MDRRVKERYNRRVVRRGLSLWSRATNKKEKSICHTRFDW